MIPSLRKLVTFPFFRWARYAALCLIAAAMFFYAFTCEEWRLRRNVFVLVLPLGFLCNSLSVEILFSKLRKGSKPPEK
jgi:hypothetical protein